MLHGRLVEEGRCFTNYDELQLYFNDLGLSPVNNDSTQLSSVFAPLIGNMSDYRAKQFAARCGLRFPDPQQPVVERTKPTLL
jgi:hypothetical protein